MTIIPSLVHLARSFKEILDYRSLLSRLIVSHLMTTPPPPANENDGEYDLGLYKYLIGTTHYDPDDKCVYRCLRVVAEDFGSGAEVVVYRSAYIAKTKKWRKEDRDPVRVRDIIEYYDNEENIAMVSSILHPKHNVIKKNYMR